MLLLAPFGASARNRAVEMQNMVIEAQNIVIEAQNKAIEAQNMAIEAQNMAIEAQNIAIRAQNRAIEALAGRYADRDGFSTTVIKGNLSNDFAGSVNIEGVDISNIIKNISSIIVVRSERPDEDFIREVNGAVASGYSTVLSSSSDGARVRFLLAENSGDKNEFVIAITGRETNLVVSIVGDYTLGKVTKPNN